MLAPRDITLALHPATHNWVWKPWGSFRSERRKVRAQRSAVQSTSAGFRRGRTARLPVCLGQGWTEQRFAGPVGPTREPTGGRRQGFLPVCHYQTSYHVSLAQEIASASILHYSCLVICDWPVREKVLLWSFQEEKNTAENLLQEAQKQGRYSFGGPDPWHM